MTDLTQGNGLVIGGVETTTTVAAKAGIDSSVVRRALRAGVLRGVKVGGTWVIAADEADHWIKTRKRGRPPKQPKQLEIVRFLDDEDREG